MTDLVRTVLGDVAPASLGTTLCHEHLIIDSPVVAQDMPQIHLPSVADAVAEVALSKAAGVGTMVDAMPEAGRDVKKLAEISRQTGVKIIAATGFHTSKYYAGRPPADDESVVDWAHRYVGDIDQGCGVIKLATGVEGMDRRATELFEAAVVAHLATGAPMITHCEEGRGAHEQIAKLATLGVKLDRVVLSHTDKVLDRGYHLELLQSGVNLEYDQALRQADLAEPPTALLLSDMIEGGHLDQLLLGTDAARRSLWTTLGGSPGMAWILTGFVPILEERVGAEAVRAVLIDNPRRWLPLLPA